MRCIRTDTDIINIKENLCWGKTLDFQSRGTLCVLSFLCSTSGLSLSLRMYTSQKRESDASVVIVLVSSVLESLLLSLFFCRCSFPRKRLVSKDRERALAAT